MDNKRQEPSGGAQAARPLGAEPTQELRGWAVVSFGGAPPRSKGGGSLTVFFTILVALVGGQLAIWRVITAHVQAMAARHRSRPKPTRVSNYPPRARDASSKGEVM